MKLSESLSGITYVSLTLSSLFHNSTFGSQAVTRARYFPLGRIVVAAILDNKLSGIASYFIVKKRRHVFEKVTPVLNNG